MKCRPLLLLPMILLGAPQSGATVVMDQIGNPDAYDVGASATPNATQIFTDFPGYDSMALDDFTVTDGELHLTYISAMFEARAGLAMFDDVLGYRVSIFSDASLASGSLLGDVATDLIALGPDVAFRPVGSGNHGLVELTVDYVLPAAGAYWVGVSPYSSKAITGQFFIQNNGKADPVLPGGNNGYFANPDDGDPATGYGPAANNPTTLDFAYALKVVPEPAASVFFIIGGLFLFLARRNRASSDRPF